VGHRVGLDGRKISSPPAFDLGPSSPVAQSLYRLSYRAPRVVLYPVILLSIFSLITFVTVVCFLLILKQQISGLKDFRLAVEFNRTLSLAPLKEEIRDTDGTCVINYQTARCHIREVRSHFTL